jgi:adenylate kinase
MRIVLLGPPGSGKGTQASRISKMFKVPHISTGDIFREAMEKKTELGKRVKLYVESGRLVPDDLVIKLMRQRLSRGDCKRGFVLDGFPRTLAQAEALERLVKVQAVLNLVVDVNEAIRRLSMRRSCKVCGATYHLLYDPPRVGGRCDVCANPLFQRVDDNENVIWERMKEYERGTRPMVNFYKEKGLLIDINGNKSIEEVFNDIVRALKKKNLIHQHGSS